MEKRWVLRQAAEPAISLLSETLKIAPLIARLLVHRGHTSPEAAKRFLSCSLSSDLPAPALMAGMDAAVERLVQALKSKEPLCVWGDYDVDGTTGASALVLFLREVGGTPIYYVPHRVDEGYGLNEAGLERLRSGGIRLVVSIDCGISNCREVEFARKLGTDVIIVDHHQPPPVLPPAIAILNPHRSDCVFPEKGLCGAGLAFYLIIGLRAKLRETGWFAETQVPDIRRYLDIIALGTIADMVPLRGANRVLVRRGLVELGGSTRPGVIALKQVAGITAGELSAPQVGFQLGPRINAAGRMDAGLKVVEMLTAESREVAYRIAQELDQHNRDRRATEASVLEQAASEVASDPAMGDRRSIVVGRPGWHPGVLGIVASRIVERFHRPTVVIGFHEGQGKGSARSIRGFHIVDAFRQCADLLEKFGGHEYAGGLTLSEDNFPLFIERFEQIARDRLGPDDLTPTLEVDAELDFPQIDFSLIREIATLEPFGIGNPEPVFITRAVEIAERKDVHGGARFRLRQANRSVTALGFRAAFGVAPGEERQPKPDMRMAQLVPGARIDVAYRLTENQWDGTVAVELRIVDAKLSN